MSAEVGTSGPKEIMSASVRPFTLSVRAQPLIQT